MVNINLSQMKNPNMAGLLWNLEDGKIIELSQGLTTIEGIKLLDVGDNWLSLLSEKDQKSILFNLNNNKKGESFLFDLQLTLPALAGLHDILCCTESFLIENNEHEETTKQVLTYIYKKTPENTVRQQLQKKSDWLEFIIEGTQVGVWDWNIKTNQLRFNEQWGNMLGIPFEELVHDLQTWSDLIHPDDKEKAVYDINAHLQGETAFYENTHRLRHRDGHWVYILDRGKVMERDENGLPIRFTGTHTDISAQKKAEELALKLAESKSSFLANMSHEIRSPLNGIIGLLDLLDDTDLNKEQKEISSVLKDCSDYLQILINDILDLSKIESGKMFLNEESFSINALLESLYKLFEPRARQKGLSFNLKKTNLPQSIYTDPIRLRQVLTNLLSNAIKFTQEGRVSLTSKVEESMLVFIVKDSGRGIQDLERVWEEFEQELETEKHFQKGTGLGLSISRKLTQMMDGELIAFSDGKSGSEFTLKIPIRQTTPTAKTKTLKKLNLKNSTFVIIEDHPVNQMVFEGYLKGFNAEVKCFSNAEQALDYTKEHNFDGIICDINLPGMNGFDFYQKFVDPVLKQTHKFFAFTSADVVSNHKQKAIELGVQFFWSKPINKEQIKKDLLSFNKIAEGF